MATRPAKKKAASSRFRMRSSHRSALKLRVSHRRPGCWRPPDKDSDSGPNRGR